MQIMDNLSTLVLIAFFTILVAVLQFASLTNGCQTEVGKSCDDRWCCEQDVDSSCLGLSEDRLNYTIECKSPGVIHVSWEVTHSTIKDDLVVNTQYSCYNSTSHTVSTWLLSDHTNLLSDHVELCNVSLGSDVSCTFTGCTNGAKVGRFYCFDYIDKEDEVTINSSCFEDSVNIVYSSPSSSMPMTPTPLLLQPLLSSPTNEDNSVLITSFSSHLPSVTVGPGPQNMHYGLVLAVLSCGLACFGLVAGFGLLLAYHVWSKRSKQEKQLHVFACSPLPSASKHITQLAFVSVQPSITGCTERNFKAKSLLQASATNSEDHPPPHATSSGSSLDPICVKCGHGQPVSAFENRDSVPDSSTHTPQIGGNGYVSGSVPTQQLEFPAE